MPIIRKIIQIGSFMVTLKQREVTTNLHSQELADLAESTFYQILIYCGWNVSRRLVTPVFVSLHIKFTIPKVLVQIALEKTSVFPLFQKKDHVANDNLVRRMTARWQSVRRQTFATTRLPRQPLPSCLDLSSTVAKAQQRNTIITLSLYYYWLILI